MEWATRRQAKARTAMKMAAANSMDECRRDRCDGRDGHDRHDECDGCDGHDKRDGRDGRDRRDRRVPSIFEDARTKTTEDNREFDG